MNIKTFTACAIVILSVAAMTEATAETVAFEDGQENLKEFREAVRLYENGMVNRSRMVFGRLADRDAKADHEGYSVLCDVAMNIPGYEASMKEFMRTHPY